MTHDLINDFHFIFQAYTLPHTLNGMCVSKEVCNGGVACSLLKLGSLEKTVIAYLFHSGLHSSSPFFVEKTTLQELLPS